MVALALALGPLVSGCFDGTYCQSGPKYGTQCYATEPQGPGNTTPPHNGSIYPIATNGRGGVPNGQKP